MRSVNEKGSKYKNPQLIEKTNSSSSFISCWDILLSYFMYYIQIESKKHLKAAVMPPSYIILKLIFKQTKVNRPCIVFFPIFTFNCESLQFRLGFTWHHDKIDYRFLEVDTIHADSMASTTLTFFSSLVIRLTDLLTNERSGFPQTNGNLSTSVQCIKQWPHISVLEKIICWSTILSLLAK